VDKLVGKNVPAGITTPLASPDMCAAGWFKSRLPNHFNHLHRIVVLVKANWSFPPEFMRSVDDEARACLPADHV